MALISYLLPLPPPREGTSKFNRCESSSPWGRPGGENGINIAFCFFLNYLINFTIEKWHFKAKNDHFAVEKSYFQQ